VPEKRTTTASFESYEPVRMGECGVKISKYENQIQVFVFNFATAETAIQWFKNEYEAVMWIEHMTEKFI
jgi:hypothetical protein